MIINVIIINMHFIYFAFYKKIKDEINSDYIYLLLNELVIKKHSSIRIK